MEAQKMILTAVVLIITVAIAGFLLLIFRTGSGMGNQALSQANNLSKEFSDVDKQKFNGMTIMGDSLVSTIQTYWEDTTCEIVVCTLDGVNAVYNIESTDGSYSVPFAEELGGMPAQDCKGRAFPSDLTISDVSKFTKTAYKNEDAGGLETYDVAAVSGYNMTNGKASGTAVIVDAAKLVQGPGTLNKTLALPNGYNSLLPVGSGGYIASTSSFVGSVQKDANGVIRRITFVQK